MAVFRGGPSAKLVLLLTHRTILQLWIFLFIELLQLLLQLLASTTKQEQVDTFAYLAPLQSLPSNLKAEMLISRKKSKAVRKRKKLLR